MTKKASILVVEDDKSLREAYRLILGSEGYAVVTANNGIEALVKLKKRRFELVLLDLLMPIMDGKEFLRNINLEDYPNTKIIILSNISDNKIEQEVLANGVDKFVLKANVGPKDLIELVKEFVQ